MNRRDFSKWVPAFLVGSVIPASTAAGDPVRAVPERDSEETTAVTDFRTNPPRQYVIRG